jgi:hypothetical protein
MRGVFVCWIVVPGAAFFRFPESSPLSAVRIRSKSGSSGVTGAGASWAASHPVLCPVRVPPVEGVGIVSVDPFGQVAFGWVRGGAVRGPAVLIYPSDQLIHPGLPELVRVDAGTGSPRRVGCVQDPVGCVRQFSLSLEPSEPGQGQREAFVFTDCEACWVGILWTALSCAEAPPDHNGHNPGRKSLPALPLRLGSAVAAASGRYPSCSRRVRHLR